MISKRGKSNTPTGIASHADVLFARYTILHPPRKSAETAVQKTRPITDARALPKKTFAGKEHETKRLRGSLP